MVHAVSCVKTACLTRAEAYAVFNTVGGCTIYQLTVSKNLVNRWQ